MPVLTTSNADLEILLADGVTYLPVMLAKPRDSKGEVVDGAPLTLRDMLAASDNDLPVSKRLQVVETEDWSGGVGLSYHEAPGVYTRTPGYACAAGAATAITIPAPAGGSSDSQIVAIAQYGTDLFAAQTGNGAANNGRVMRSTDGGTTWTNSLSLGANRYARDLLVFDDGAGTGYLYVSVADVKDPDPGAVGIFYRWNGAAWSAASTDAAPYSRQRLRKVFWVDEEGIGDWRMVAISGSKTISYTRPGVDPFSNTPTQWVEGVKIRTGVNLLRLTGSRRHIYVTAEDGVFDFDEQGNSPSITDYTDTLIHGANGLAAEYLDGSIFCALGQGLDRIDISQAGRLQENIGNCAPGWGTPAENRWRGWTTELAKEQGYLVNAMHNPSTAESAIFWGKDRTILGIDSPNSMIWYGPEIVLTGGYKVTAMKSHSPSEDELRFIVSAWKSATAPVMFRVSLPIAGSPIQDFISGGKHRYATGTAVTVGTGTAQPYSRIHLLPEAFGSRTSLKIIHQDKFSARGLGAGTKLILEERADPTPGQTTWTTSTDVTTNDQTVSPATVVSGRRIERRISFVNASSSVVGVLDAHRTSAWRTVPSVAVKTLTIEYGDGIVDIHGAPMEERSPDEITTLLDALIAAGGRTTIRDRQDNRFTVRIEQVRDTVEQLAEGRFGKTCTVTLELDIIAAA